MEIDSSKIIKTEKYEVDIKGDFLISDIINNTIINIDYSPKDETWEEFETKVIDNVKMQLNELKNKLETTNE